MESPKMRSCPSLIDKFVGSEYDTIVKIADALPMLLELYKVFQGKEDKLAVICTEIAANGNYFALTDYKNARAWGYIGDGTYHPLQEWEVFWFGGYTGSLPKSDFSDPIH